jgi:hypothetical protein
MNSLQASITAPLIAKGVKISNSGAMYRLKEMVARNELVKRKTMINGAQTNLYSKP